MVIEKLEKIYITEKDVAKIIGCSIQTLRNARHLGRGLDYVKNGKSVRYYKPDVYAFMNERKVKPGSEAV